MGEDTLAAEGVAVGEALEEEGLIDLFALTGFGTDGGKRDFSFSLCILSETGLILVFELPFALVLNLTLEVFSYSFTLFTCIILDGSKSGFNKTT